MNYISEYSKNKLNVFNYKWEFSPSENLKKKRN